MSGEGAPTFRGQLVGAAAPTGDGGPAGPDQPRVFEPAQRRVDGPGRQVEGAGAAVSKRLDHGVPVLRLVLQGGQ